MIPLLKRNYNLVWFNTAHKTLFTPISRIRNFHLSSLNQGGHKKQTERYKIQKPPISTTKLIKACTEVPIYPPTLRADIRKLTNKQWRNYEGQQLTRLGAEYHGIFDDLIHTFVPRINLIVEWKKHNRWVYAGNALTPTQTAEKPDVYYEISVNPGLWSLFMVDPDFPARQDSSSRSLLHWLIVNIPGGSVSHGDTLVDYLPPIPLKRSGVHRYAFVLAQQKSPIHHGDDLPRVPHDKLEGRSKFDLEGFLKHRDMIPKGLCFFQACWDENVGKVYQEVFGTLEPVFTPVTGRRPAFLDKRYFV
eukprot:TRINITY_DN681_c0_g2_i1.p1 TRINITY_DN681_c0_g2~~TRINITY_DN681_c0_g2_i1.p1  ORF type:complete len:304 (-),score=51.94 TRINITY_DN681_c0_g2_i1:83-994(-)